MRRVLAYLLTFVCAVAADAATAVWIDTDPAIGPPWREVDDAFALLLALRSPELRLVGISSTYGNAPLPRTSRVTRELVRRFGQVQVFDGASSAADRARESSATQALNAALRREKNLTYIALGPLTNLATFLRLHPQQASRIRRVVLLGGLRSEADLVLGPSGWPRISDANIVKDPASASEVLRSGIPVTVGPIAAASCVRLSRSAWQEIARGPAGDYLRPRTHVWLWFWSCVSGTEGGPLFDVLPLVAVARPDLVGSDISYARIDDRGALLITDKQSPGAVRVRVLRPPRNAATELLAERLGTGR
jgi:inosine-uridine nucleoside N-ribohydrolase